MQDLPEREVCRETKGDEVRSRMNERTTSNKRSTRHYLYQLSPRSRRRDGSIYTYLNKLIVRVNERPSSHQRVQPHEIMGGASCGLRFLCPGMCPAAQSPPGSGSPREREGSSSSRIAGGWHETSCGCLFICPTYSVFGILVALGFPGRSRHLREVNGRASGSSNMQGGWCSCLGWLCRDFWMVGWCLVCCPFLKVPLGEQHQVASSSLKILSAISTAQQSPSSVLRLLSRITPILNSEKCRLAPPQSGDNDNDNR
ncbi:hypothetical protein K402DRAFT_181031 [Aulographum hederae CBS 113979]|uniref:Uncharacterized protein n=1 Tax=Aulographum hederae CBS 113979 TaxID=1176131 RepID=A0A6G1GQE3_9PEZI|nr:hypothetical protein K402DRAFT_181031 [Aulographum hederae CBS 113979]